MKIEFTERQLGLIAAFIFEGITSRSSEPGNEHAPIEITATPYGSIEEIEELLSVITPVNTGLAPAH